MSVVVWSCFDNVTCVDFVVVVVLVVVGGCGWWRVVVGGGWWLCVVVGDVGCHVVNTYVQGRARWNACPPDTW